MTMFSPLRLLICFVLMACGSVAAQEAAPESVPTQKLETVSEISIPDPATAIGNGPLRTDRKWFRKLWTSKRSVWTDPKIVAAQQGAVVFLGDSITQNWNEDFRKQFPGLKTANRGISGDTTRGMLIRLQDVLDLNPSAVVLLMGTNDIEEAATPEVALENLKSILQRLKSHNAEMPIILNLVFPSHPTKRRPTEQIVAMNKLFSAAVKADPQVTVIDTYKLWATDDGTAPQAQFPDFVHLNQSGYETWAGALRPLLDELGLMPEKADSE